MCCIYFPPHSLKVSMLTHCMQLVSFYTPWKFYKTFASFSSPAALHSRDHFKHFEKLPFSLRPLRFYPILYASTIQGFQKIFEFFSSWITNYKFNINYRIIIPSTKTSFNTFVHDLALIALDVSVSDCAISYIKSFDIALKCFDKCKPSLTHFMPLTSFDTPWKH